MRWTGAHRAVLCHSMPCLAVPCQRRACLGRPHATRAAGLRLDARFADMAGTAFTADSAQHVSIYRLAEQG